LSELILICLILICRYRLLFRITITVTQTFNGLTSAKAATVLIVGSGNQPLGF